MPKPALSSDERAAAAGSLPGCALPAGPLIEAALGPATHVVLRRRGDQRAEIFRSAYDSAAARNVLVLDLAKRAGRWLSGAGIPFVALKGISTIARFCREDAAIRPMADADLLISRRDFARAVSLLEKRGLKRKKPPHPVTNRWASEVSLLSPGAGIRSMLDLHQSFHNWPLLESFSRWVLHSREGVDGWTVPSVSASMLVIAAHRFRHAFAGDARELLDMVWLSAAADEDVWRETVDAAGRFDLLPALYVVYRQAVGWFGAESGPGRAEDPSGRRGGTERERLEELRGRVRRPRAGLLDRLVPVGAGVMPSDTPLLPSGFLGQYVSMAVGMTRPLHAVAAMGLYTSSRLADEVFSGGKSGFPWRGMGGGGEGSSS